MHTTTNLNLNCCRICGFETTSLTRVKEYNLSRCHNCKFVQVDEKPDEAILNQIYSDIYFKHSKYQNTTALHHENKRRLNLLNRFVPKGSKVLDAGCSTGDFILMSKTDYSLYGLDLSEYAIEMAKTKNPEIAEHIVTGKLEESWLSKQTFDAICLWDVAEHLWDPVTVIDELLKRLSPGGFLFLSTPAIDSTVAKVMKRYWAFMTPPEHLSFFTSETFKWMFNSKFDAKIMRSFRRGKWANIAFVAYKLNRIAPSYLPKWLLSPFQSKLFSKINVYIPTRDVRYVAIQNAN